MEAYILLQTATRGDDMHQRHLLVQQCRYKASAEGILCFRQGLVPLEGCVGESSTQGLDRLDADCKSYRQQGARFCKWRAALRIGNGTPSQKAIDINAQQLAQYAAVAQVHLALVLLSERSPGLFFLMDHSGLTIAWQLYCNMIHIRNFLSSLLLHTVSIAIADMRPGAYSRA